MMWKLAICLLAFGAACSGDDSNGDDDVPPGGDGGPPPFTDGVSTLAGSGEAGFVDGERAISRFNNPVNAVVGPDGMLYVADFDNSKIRVVDPANGTTRTLIDQPELRRPFGLAFSGNTLFITTDCNSTSQQQGPMTGTIWKVENGVAFVLAENIGRPRGIAALANGQLAISDYQHHVIQLVNPTTGAITPLAGTWDSAGMADGRPGKMAAPYGIGVLDNTLIFADQENQRLRAVSLDGTVSAFAGAGVTGYGDGSVTMAKLSSPQGIAIANGIVYFTDTGNFRVRRVVGGMVETVAGSGEGGYLDADDPLTAQLFGLEGLAVQPDGAMVFVADGSRGDAVPYNRVRRIEIH